MLNDKERDVVVRSLLDSHRTKVRGQRPSELFPNIEIADSYAISSLVAEERMKAGARVVGHKIGLTSKAMQASSSVDQPDYGYLFDDLVLDDGATVEVSDFCAPRVEPELAFVLKEPLSGPGVGLLDVLRATEFVVPCIEIIDARVQDPRKIYDTIADNAAAAGVVLGGRPVRPDEVDLRWVGALFYRNAEIEETGLAAAVLGHPATAVAWLANKLAAFNVTLEPSQLLLSGSFTRPVSVRKGDTIHADFGPLGSVSVQFS